MPKLTRDVLVLSTGLSKRAGASVGQGEVPTSVWEAWIAEGIVDLNESAPPAPPKPEVKVDEAPLPHGGASLNPVVEKPEGDSQLRELPLEDLKAMGKKFKVPSWHLMKRDTLIEKLEKLS